jgi:hypothetical protein
MEDNLKASMWRTLGAPLGGSGPAASGKLAVVFHYNLNAWARLFLAKKKRKVEACATTDV